MTRSIIVAGAMFLLTTVASAAPIVGTFNSPDMGDDFLNGRWSESFTGGGRFSVGNVLHAASWDGVSLDTQWAIDGPTLSSATVLSDYRFRGTGDVIRRADYSGGVMTLKSTGPWAASGEGDYLVDIAAYSHTCDEVYVNNVLTTYRTTVFLSGTFRDYPGYEVSFVIASAAPVGLQASMPLDYPVYQGAAVGDYGVVQKITMEIVPEPTVLVMLAAGLVASIRRKRT